MKIKDMLIELISELGNFNDFGFNFMTSKSGIQCGFTPKSIALFYKLSETIHINDPDFETIELNNFIKIVKQCTIDFYTENKLNNFETNQIEVMQKLKQSIKDTTKNQMTIYTHYIPVHTLGFEKIKTLKLGNIHIMNIQTWIDSINITGRECFDNFNWKQYLKDSVNKIKTETPNEPCDWMIESVFNAIEKAPAMIKITIKGFEKDYSYKLANIIAKTTLDSISLLFNKDVFYQQILLSERTIPIMTHGIVETDGNLWLPSSSLSSRIPIISPKQSHEELLKKDNQKFLQGISEILYALENPQEAKYPKLSSRWATALDWYAEGIREQNDAIALTKIATSLDVLSNGGKYNGILNMLQTIYGISENDIILKDIKKETSLKEFVKEIYDYGRSQILHGTHYERLKSFKRQREQASIITRTALFGCLFLLADYTEEDLDAGFRELQKLNKTE
ncbi:hypothetical protein [Sulfurimonas sp.]|uniref:hypothetical protein n=1 Tax=Sulfurimonas sp. TaxID=2022749 RepID=UPI002B49892B|nr:hypothetical protein [Sulfurimonas sp.]